MKQLQFVKKPFMGQSIQDSSKITLFSVMEWAIQIWSAKQLLDNFNQNDLGITVKKFIFLIKLQIRGRRFN